MPSTTADYLDPSTWRLNLNGVPVSLINRAGSFAGLDGETTAVETYLVPANRLLEFAVATFPRPFVSGARHVQRTTQMPGLPFLRADRVTWRAHVPGLPVDPFATDLSADSRTYGSVVEVDVTYKMGTQRDESDDDPRTFLEITSNTTGEFLHGGAGNCFWNADRTTTQSLATRNRGPNVPVTITVPETEWTLRWPLISGKFFEEILVGRLRSRLGKVNSTEFEILYDAAPQTIMFVGYDYTERPLFTGNTVSTLQRALFVEVNMKFLEKHVEDKDGNVRGHNDFWREGVGWQYLLCGDTVGSLDPVFVPTDMNDIFTVGRGSCEFRFVAADNEFVLQSTNCLDGWQCPGPPPVFPDLVDGDRVTRDCIPP